MKINNISSKIKKILPVIGISIFIYLILDIGIDKIWYTFSKISVIYVLFIFLVSILSMIFYNFQWQLIFKKQKIKIGFFESLKILFIGDFYRSISPACVGTWMKIPYLKEKTDEPYGKLFINCLILSVLSTLTFLLLLTLCSFSMASMIPIAFPIVSIIFAIIAAILLFFINKQRGEKALHILIRFFVPKKSKPFFNRFISTFYKDFPSIKGLVIPFIMGLIGITFYYSILYTLALELEITITFSTFIMVYPFVTAVSFLPISPGSIGIRELTAASIFSLFGVGMAEAVVLSLAAYLLFSTPSVLIGFVFSSTWVKNAKKDRIRISSIKKFITTSFKS